MARWPKAGGQTEWQHLCYHAAQIRLTGGSQEEFHPRDFGRAENQGRNRKSRQEHPDSDFVGRDDMKKRKTSSVFTAAAFAGLAIALGTFAPLPSHAQGHGPKFEVDPSWPKPLPNLWVTGGIGGVCVDAQDHVFILNRRDLTDNELDAGHQAPPVIEFDAEGNVVNSFGDPNVVPSGFHGCTVDRENNLWLAGSDDGIVQKYTHDGSKLQLQIGKRGVVDSSDGTLKGKAFNSSHAAFFRPAGIASDPQNGDFYVADGESPGANHRIAVFDDTGKFLRQWELRRTEAETGDAFVPVVHCVALDKDGRIYACDRRGHRLQVFDKMGNFQRNIPIKFEQRSAIPPGPGHSSGALGSAVSVGFSQDPAQSFLYVTNQDNEQIDILDRASGQILSSFGRAGHQVGEFTYAHFLAVDSKGNIYVTEVGVGKRVQKFKMVSNP
jgi:sugar lactone lactonase YvrE